MIKLTDLLEAEKAFTATSKETGNVSVFKTKASRDAAVKAGSHEKRKTDKDDAVDVPTGEKKPNMFSKDTGYNAPDSDKKEPKSKPSKYDSKYFADDEKVDKTYDFDDFSDDSEGVKKTIERLDKIEKALEDDLKLNDNGFTTARSSGGGMGSYEGPLEIYDKNAIDDNGEPKDGASTLSIGSGENDGNFSVALVDFDGAEIFDGDYAITGDRELSAEEAFKLGKTLMKMPEVQKFLKGEISKDEFQSTYDKIQSKFGGESSESEPEEEPKSEPTKDSSGGRAGNPKVNKVVRDKAKKLGITPQKLGKEEYESRMSKAAVEALTDANFHSEARKLISVFEDNPDFANDPNKDPNKPDPFDQPDEYDEWRANSVYASTFYDSAEGTDAIAHSATGESGWDGIESLDAIAYDLKMNGSKKLAAKLQSIFEGITKRGFKNHRLKDFLK